MLPPTVSVLTNIRSFKNRQDGLFVRSTDNLLLDGGIFADNRNQVNLEISQNIVVDGTTMIGRTNTFNEIVQAQGTNVVHDEISVGVELHVRSLDLLETGATIRNVQFSGFHRNFATRTSLFDVNVENTRAWDGIFSFWSLLENISVDDMSSTNPFDLRKTTAANHAAVYIVDRDSSLKPIGTSARTSSTIIADSADVKAFCDLNNSCHHDSQHGNWYCRDTCLRTLLFLVDPTDADGLALEIIDEADSSRSFSYSGIFLTEYLDDGSLDHVANTDWAKYVTFAAALPMGSYVARFKRNASIVWPTFVETVWGPSLCDEGATPGSVRLAQPTVGLSVCQELIRNGDMEAGTTSPWLNVLGAGVMVEGNKGRFGSNALGDLDQSLALGGMGQYIDTRCLTTGTIYDIRVLVRLERPNGSIVACGNTNCGPRLKFRTLAEVGAGEPLERQIRLLSYRFEEPLQSDWNLLYARVTMDDEWTQASSVFVYVDRGRTNVRLYLDDFSMTRVEE